MSRAIRQSYSFGDFTVDTEQKILLRQGKPLPLTPKVFDTLLVLIENYGRIVEKETLMNRLWPDTFVEEANLGFNIQQLRKALGDDARHPRFIETVARRGYRFIAPVKGTLDDSVLTNAIPPTPIGVQAADSQFTVGGDEFESDLGLAKSRDIVLPGTGKSDRAPKIGAGSNSGRWRTLLAASALAVTLVAAGLLLWLRYHSSARAQPETGRLMMAVLPFQNLTGDQTQDYFSDGLTEEMITQLGNLDPGHVGVIARTSVMQYKNSREPIDRIGRELQIQYVLEGSVRRESDRVRITAQLIQMKDQSHIWAREYEREVGDLLSLQSEIAREVTDEIHLTLGSQARHEPASQTSSPTPTSYEAYDLYLKGQYFFNQRSVAGFLQAVDYFKQATTKDPTYARAYAGLADCYALIGGYSERPEPDFMPKARDAARRAIELDGNLAEAHTALALIVQNYDWDWQTAEKEFRRALELNPNYATAHHWYAEHLTWLGRFDEALSESERARQLDPLSLIIAADKGAILYYSRQYDRAISQFLAVREMDPNFPRTGVIRSAYEQKGQYAYALEEIEKWRHAYGDKPWTWSELAYVYGRSGQRAQAEHALQKLLQLDRHQPVDPAAVAWAYLGVGDNGQAIAYLEKAYVQHSSTITSLKVEPRFDPLRSDPRYQDLQRRVGLAQ